MSEKSERRSHTPRVVTVPAPERGILFRVLRSQRRTALIKLENVEKKSNWGNVCQCEVHVRCIGGVRKEDIGMRVSAGTGREGSGARGRECIRSGSRDL